MESWEVPKFVVQKDRMSEDLPFGSRGGLSIPYNFVSDGEYLIRVRLKRQYQDYLEGMGWKQQVEIRLDGKLVKRFSVGGEGKGRAAAASYAGDGEVDFAGDPGVGNLHAVDRRRGNRSAAFRAGRAARGRRVVRARGFEPEDYRSLFNWVVWFSNDQIYMDYASVGTVQICGPYELKGPPKDTPSRRAIFTCYPTQVAQERDCANTILSQLAVSWRTGVR